MAAIPTYSLYGEKEQSKSQNWLHWETVNARSRLHDFRIAPHRHEQFFQVLYLTRGIALATIDGGTVALTLPALVVIPALTVHGYGFSADIEGIVLTLMDRDVQALLASTVDLADSFAGPLLLQGIDLDDIGDLAQQLIAEADRGSTTHGAAMQALITLLLIAIHRARGTALAGAAGTVSPAVSLARAFRQLVDQRYRDTRAIRDYASALHISATHLNRVSRAVLGLSALAVIERRIALEARRHLLFSSLSIQQVGALLGYPDPAYFTRFCTRELGVSPSRYRRLVRAGLT